MIYLISFILMLILVIRYLNKRPITDIIEQEKNKINKRQKGLLNKLKQSGEESFMYIKASRGCLIRTLKNKTVICPDNTIENDLALDDLRILNNKNYIKIVVENRLNGFIRFNL